MTTSPETANGPALMAAAAAEAARVVAGAAKAANTKTLEQTTPCTDWDLRTLLNHMILWTSYSAERRAYGESAAMLIAEMVLHGWDIAQATGQDYHCDDAVARNVLKTVEAQGELFRQYQGFAAIVPVPADATALDRALALSGRDPES
jgi:hypothetical protein